MLAFWAKDCLTPLQLRKKAFDLGFEARSKVRPPLPSLPVSMVPALGQVHGARPKAPAKKAPRGSVVESLNKVKTIAAAWPKAQPEPALFDIPAAALGQVASASGEELGAGFTTDDSYDLVSSLSLPRETDGEFEHEGDPMAAPSAPSGPEADDGSAILVSETEGEDFDVGDYQFVTTPRSTEDDRNPESPLASPRWTAKDYERLENVMSDLSELNKKLLVFTPKLPGLEEEEEEVVDDEEAAQPEPAELETVETKAFGQAKEESPEVLQEELVPTSCLAALMYNGHRATLKTFN